MKITDQMKFVLWKDTVLAAVPALMGELDMLERGAGANVARIATDCADMVVEFCTYKFKEEDDGAGEDHPFAGTAQR